METTRWITAEVFALKLGLRSIRVAQKVLNQILESLPQDYRLAMESFNKEVDKCVFPELSVSAETGMWQEKKGSLLSFKASQLFMFRDAGKKVIYTLC